VHLFIIELFLPTNALRQFFHILRIKKTVKNCLSAFVGTNNSITLIILHIEYYTKVADALQVVVVR
jgi:hypothetical protein